MRRAELRARILAALGAGGIVSGTLVACGSDTTTAGAADASADHAAEATGDAPSDVGSGDDGATFDASNDANEDVDARPPTPRRPFLVGASLRSAPGEARDDWASYADQAPPDDTIAIDPVTRKKLAIARLEDGLQEHASVAAFARFAMMSMGVGAPADLVTGALRASLDEIAHAKACFALAARYGAAETGPGPLAVSDAIGACDLASLVALAVEEGCVGETLGVVVASEQLSRATDPRVRRLLERIEKDEARHAELAWRFVAWAIAKDARTREVVADAAQRAIASARAIPIRPHGADPATWAAHGRLACRDARDVVDRGIREVLEPCLVAVTVDRTRSSRDFERRRETEAG